MYRPSMYYKHDDTMTHFAEMFNASPVCRNIKMKPNPVETFDNDGYIVDETTNRAIGFDWEYRDKYFSNCKLQFDSLGQYERKITKPSIQISLQCDSTETGVAVGGSYRFVAKTHRLVYGMKATFLLLDFNIY